MSIRSTDHLFNKLLCLRLSRKFGGICRLNAHKNPSRAVSCWTASAAYQPQSLLILTSSVWDHQSLLSTTWWDVRIYEMNGFDCFCGDALHTRNIRQIRWHFRMLNVYCHHSQPPRSGFGFFLFTRSVGPFGVTAADNNAKCTNAGSDVVIDISCLTNSRPNAIPIQIIVYPQWHMVSFMAWHMHS